MHLIGIRKLVDIQVPQVLTNLIFAYSGRDITSPIPFYQTKHLGLCDQHLSEKIYGLKIGQILSIKKLNM